MWNLTKGKVTYHSKLASEADLVAFHPDGDKVGTQMSQTGTGAMYQPHVWICG